MTDPNTEDRARLLRQAMVAGLATESGRVSAATAAAMRAVPRHQFVSGSSLEQAYDDDAIVTRTDAQGRGLSSISQPSLIADMLELLALRPGHRVLEIGAGTGYNAALLAELVGPTGQVTTIDIDSAITDEAHRNLDAAGYGRVTVTCADGALGEAAGAPWDRIIVSTGAWEPAPEWIRQLHPGHGRMILPMGLRVLQRILCFTVSLSGLQSTAVRCGGFLHQRGRDTYPVHRIDLGADVELETEMDLGLKAGPVVTALGGQAATEWTGVTIGHGQRYDRLLAYLAVHYPGFWSMRAPTAFLPRALRAWGRVYGITDGDGLAHLQLEPRPNTDDDQEHEIGVTGYGTTGPQLAELIAEDVRAWATNHETDPVVTVTPNTGPDSGPHDGTVLPRRYSAVTVSWPEPADRTEVFQMRLLPEPFEWIALGKKTIEVRANDCKRRPITAGCRIRFTCGDRVLETEVIRVTRYANFAQLFEHEDTTEINPDRGKAEQLTGIEAMYSPTKRALGAVAIEIRNLSTG